MSEQMEKVLEEKLAERRRVLDLPIEEKITIMENLRDLALSIQRPIVVEVSGTGVALGAPLAHKTEVMPPVSRQLQGQPRIPRNSVTLFARLGKRPEHWQLSSMEQFEPEEAFR